jgi:diacylglycerol kinase family enzyme
MSGIGVVYNPKAGKNKKNNDNLTKVKHLLRDSGMVRETRTETELTEAVLEFKKNGVEIIAISGGDGTIHRVLSNTIKNYGDTPLPKFMSLRSGTMNTFTNAMKFKGNPFDILEKTIESLTAGRALREVHQHLMKVDDKYGFMTGAGVVSHYLDRYYQSKNPGPAVGAKIIALIILSTLFQTRYAKDIFRPTRLKVTIDGKVIENDGFMILMGCVIKEVGLGFKPTHRAYEKPGHFHFIASTMKPFAMIPKLPSLWLGRDIIHPAFQHNGIAQEVIIEKEGELKWMIDGDLYVTDKPLHLSVGPTITVVSPG